MSQIEQPSFLPQTEGFGNHIIGEGSFVRVVEFSSVSPRTAEQVPVNYVLKEYNLDPNNFEWEWWQDLFMGDPDIDALKESQRIGTPAKEWSLSRIASRLKARHDTLQKFFTAQGLADFVVPTHFIVGAEKHKTNPDRDGKKHVYEIQRKIGAVEIPFKVEKDVDTIYAGFYREPFSLPPKLQTLSGQEIKTKVGNASKDIAEFLVEKLDKEQLAVITQQLDAILKAVKRMPKELGILVEDILKPDNLLITVDGLRLIDTNSSLPWPNQTTDSWEEKTVIPSTESSDQEIVSGLKQRYDRLLFFWESVRDELFIHQLEPAD